MILFFLFTFYIYLINVNDLTSIDTQPARFTVYSWFYEKDFDLNEFYHKPIPDEKYQSFSSNHKSIQNILLMEYKKRTDPIRKRIYRIDSVAGVLIPIDGKLYGPFSLGPVLYQGIFVMILKIFHFPVLNFEKITSYFPDSHIQFDHRDFHLGEPFQLERISAAFLGCLILYSFWVLLYQLQLYRLINPFFILFIYGYSTYLFTIESQALWQHGFVELFSIILLIVVHRCIENPVSEKFFWMGLLIMLAFYFRPTSIFITIPIYLYFVYKYYKVHKEIVIFKIPLLLGFLIVFLPFSILNYIIYYHIGGGYFVALLDPLNEGVKFDIKNYLLRLYWIVFSPSRGIIFFILYFPLVVLALKRKEKWDLKLVSIGIIILYHLFYATFEFWHGGWSYGMRFFAELNPFYLILFIFSYAYSNLLIKILANILIFLSMLIQIQGSFAYSRLFWNCRISSLNVRVNNWKHPQQLYFLEQILPLIKKDVRYTPEDSCILNYYKEKDRYYISTYSFRNLKQGSEYINRIFFATEIYLPENSCITFYFDDFNPDTDLIFKFKNQTFRSSMQRQLSFSIENSKKFKKVLINIFTKKKAHFIFNGYQVQRGNCIANQKKYVYHIRL